MAKGRNKHPMRLDIFNVPALPVIFSAEGTDEDQPLSPLQSEVLDSVRQQALAVLENDLKPQAVTGDRSETLNEMKERAIQEITELAMRKIVPDQTKQVNSKQPDINGSDCQVQEAAVELDPVVPPDTSWETFKKLYDEYRRPGGSFQLKTGYYPNATLLKNEFIDICVGIGWKTDPMKDLWDEHYANTKHLVVTGDDDPNKVWKMKELEPYYNELMSKIDARLKLLNLHTSPGPRQEMYRIVKEILWEMKQ
jgi:hypothetical protein